MIKISKKLIAPFLSYSIFLRGLFFMPHPVDIDTHNPIAELKHPRQRSDSVTDGV